jgi:hypothetical protein
MQIGVKPGVLYFLKGKEDGRVRELIVGLRSNGYQMLVVSHKDPLMVKNELDVPSECILTLTETIGQYSVDPQNLIVLTDTIIKFLENGRPSSVLIEDLLLLKQKNEFSKVLRFVGFVYESLAMNRGIGFALIDPQFWDTKEMAYLGKEGYLVGEKDRLDVKGLHPNAPKAPLSQNV